MRMTKATLNTYKKPSIISKVCLIRHLLKVYFTISHIISTLKLIKALLFKVFHSAHKSRNPKEEPRIRVPMTFNRQATTFYLGRITWIIVPISKSLFVVWLNWGEVIFTSNLSISE